MNHWNPRHFVPWAGFLSPVFRPYWTIWQPDTNLPFEYQTSPVFRWLLYSNNFGIRIVTILYLKAILKVVLTNRLGLGLPDGSTGSAAEVGETLPRATDLDKCEVAGVCDVALVTIIECGRGVTLFIPTIFCIFPATVYFSASFSTTFDCHVFWEVWSWK